MTILPLLYHVPMSLQNSKHNIKEGQWQYSFRELQIWTGTTLCPPRIQT